MNNRVIEVCNCDDCPFKAGNICQHPDLVRLSEGEKEIPDSSTFPEFCPLEDAEDFAESNFNPDREED